MSTHFFPHFVGELAKVAVATQRLKASKTRSGRRPMRVSTMLRKEKDGSFYKESKTAAMVLPPKEEAVGVEVGDGKKKLLSGSEAKKKVKDTTKLLEDINEYLLMSSPKLAAAYWREKRAWEDQIPGGKADKKKPSDFDPKQLQMGIKIEKEHVGDDKALAEEIAMDHLTEFDNYYSALKQMEKKLETEKEKKADSTKPQWLEMPYTEGERSMQNVPVMSKRGRGDAPTADGSENFYSAKTNPTWQPPGTAIAPKVAEALHPLVRSTTDTMPDRGSDGAPIRMYRMRDEATVMGPTGSPRNLEGEFNSPTKVAFVDEFLKLAAVTPEEAEASFKRLKALEETKPTGGQIARGALAGTVGGAASQLARGLVTGDIVQGIRESMKEPTLSGFGKNLALRTLKNVGGTVAGTAAFGSTLPLVRQHLDRQAEIAKLKEFLGQEQTGTVPKSLHHKITKVVGV